MYADENGTLWISDEEAQALEEYARTEGTEAEEHRPVLRLIKGGKQ